MRCTWFGQSGQGVSRRCAVAGFDGRSVARGDKPGRLSFARTVPSGTRRFSGPVLVLSTIEQIILSLVCSETLYVYSAQAIIEADQSLPYESIFAIHHRRDGAPRRVRR